MLAAAAADPYNAVMDVCFTMERYLVVLAQLLFSHFNFLSLPVVSTTSSAAREMLLWNI